MTRIDSHDIDYWVRQNPGPLQRIGSLLTRRLGRWLFRLREYGTCAVPESGAFIIAPNHGSYIDGFFFVNSLRRSVRFMTSHGVMRWPVIGRLLRWIGGFPVERGRPGQPALEISRRVLENGQGLIMFMEGRLVRDPGLGEPRRGLAVLALQTGATIVPAGCFGNKPAYVFGRRRWPWAARTTLVWGEAMRFDVVADPAIEQVEQARDEIWAEVERLHDIARDLHLRPAGRPRSFEVPSRTAGGAHAGAVGANA